MIRFGNPGPGTDVASFYTVVAPTTLREARAVYMRNKILKFTRALAAIPSSIARYRGQCQAPTKKTVAQMWWLQQGSPEVKRYHPFPIGFPFWSSSLHKAFSLIARIVHTWTLGETKKKEYQFQYQSTQVISTRESRIFSGPRSGCFYGSLTR